MRRRAAALLRTTHGGLPLRTFLRTFAAEGGAASGAGGGGAGGPGATGGSGRRDASDNKQSQKAKEERARAVSPAEAAARRKVVEADVEMSMERVVKNNATNFNPSWSPTGPPYRYRLPRAPKAGEKAPSDRDDYDDHSGLRFPTMETAENIDYHKDRGLNRVIERSYPIKVPGYRRLDPYLREYIFFLHNLDPARFSITRIAQRYRMREKTVAKVVQEWGTNRYLTRTGLTKMRDKQQTKEAVILAKKEQQYAKWVGWDQLGDEDDPDTDDEAIGDTKGWKSTSDWVRRQSVEVEMMSAFPMMEKRDPVPKRVDVDVVVDSRQHHKIINWVDPTDKVVF